MAVALSAPKPSGGQRWRRIIPIGCVLDGQRAS